MKKLYTNNIWYRKPHGLAFCESCTSESSDDLTHKNMNLKFGEYLFSKLKNKQKINYFDKTQRNRKNTKSTLLINWKQYLHFISLFYSFTFSKQFPLLFSHPIFIISYPKSPNPAAFQLVHFRKTQIWTNPRVLCQKPRVVHEKKLRQLLPLSATDQKAWPLREAPQEGSQVPDGWVPQAKFEYKW